MSFQTASAILRGRWLIDQSWTESNLPLILQMAEGKAVDFGEEKNEAQEPVRMSSRANAAAYKVGYFTDLSKLPDGSIAVLDIVGPVTKYGDLCSYGSVDHATTISRLANSPNVSGIVLNIDSPGGQVDGTSMLADAISAAAGKKPVVALIDDGMAASAAMWIASAASEIYVSQKTDMVGSIGVYSTIADWYAYAKSQGLPVRDVYAPQSTDKNGSYRAAIDGNDTPLKNELSVIADEFIKTIRQNRAGKLTSDQWTTGAMFYASQAKKIGLIDGIKSFDQVAGRMNSLIKERQQKSNSLKMNYQKTFAAAQIAAGEAPEQINEGLWFTESQVASMEVAFTNHESVQQLQKTELTSLRDEVSGLKESATAKDAEIAALKLENDQLKNSAAPIGQTTKKGTDNFGSATEAWPLTSVDAEADKQRLFLNS
jgi:protease-4